MTRGEKIHSPHTSPKLLRKTPQLPPQEKDAGGSSSTKSNSLNGKQSKPPPIVSSSSGSTSSSASSSNSSMSSISKAPLIDVSCNESPVQKTSTVTQDQNAPPIPPRKSTISSDFNRPLKPQPAPPPPEKVESPQIPEHKPKHSFLCQDDNFEDEDEDPICGPAETITGKNQVHKIE